MVGRIAALEQHSLWCHACLDVVLEMEDYVDTIRVGLLNTNEPGFPGPPESLGTERMKEAAPTEAAGYIIDGGRESKMAILVEVEALSHATRMRPLSGTSQTPSRWRFESPSATLSATPDQLSDRGFRPTNNQSRTDKRIHACAPDQS